MEATLLQSAQTQGLWALLFVSLLIFILKDSSKREAKYQSIIEKLSETINIELKEIRTKINTYMRKE